VYAGFAAAGAGSFGSCGMWTPILLTRAVQQGSFGERAAFGSFVGEAGRVFLAEGAASLLFRPAGM
jgi:hypothetical protein